MHSDTSILDTEYINAVATSLERPLSVLKVGISIPGCAKELNVILDVFSFDAQYYGDRTGFFRMRH